MNLPRLTRPARAGGFLLIGVAVIATAIGTASAMSGDGDSDTAAPGQTTTSPAPHEGHGSQTTEAPSGSSSSSKSSAPSSSKSTDGSESSKPSKGESGSDGDQADGDDDGGNGGTWDSAATGALKSVPVRVYNNSTIRSLATKAAEDFRSNDWTVTKVDNYSAGKIPTTTVYFRPGTDEEAAAKLLAQEFGLRVEPRFDGIKKSSPGIIVIVTKDYEATTAK